MRSIFAKGHEESYTTIQPGAPLVSVGAVQTNTALSAVADNLKEHLENLTGMEARLGSFLARIHGPRPLSGKATGDEPQPAGMGGRIDCFVNDIHQATSRIFSLLDEIDRIA